MRVGVNQVGYFSAVAKGALRRIPIWGWGFKLAASFLFLARNFEKDEGRIRAWMAAVARARALPHASPPRTPPPAPCRAPARAPPLPPPRTPRWQARA